MKNLNVLKLISKRLQPLICKDYAVICHLLAALCSSTEKIIFNHICFHSFINFPLGADYVLLRST